MLICKLFLGYMLLDIPNIMERTQVEKTRAVPKLTIFVSFSSLFDFKKRYGISIVLSLRFCKLPVLKALF